MDAKHRFDRCPLCRREALRFLDVPAPGSAAPYTLYKCRACAICYTRPLPSGDELSRIYSGGYWVRRETAKAAGAAGHAVEWLARQRLAVMIRPLLAVLPPGAAVLEVGCGSGALAAHLKRCGFDIEVTDIDREIIDEITSRYGLRGHCGNLEEIPFERTFDAVIFNHVLEHLPAPDKTLQSAAALVRNSGVVFIEVPNIESLQFRIFKEKWFHLVIPQHLYHFSIRTLDAMAWSASLQRTWVSTFSPRTSAAGYVASLSPALQPDALKRSWSLPKLLIYAMLQCAAAPMVCLESWLGRGAVLRAVYRKRKPSDDV